MTTMNQYTQPQRKSDQYPPCSGPATAGIGQIWPEI